VADKQGVENMESGKNYRTILKGIIILLLIYCSGAYASDSAGKGKKVLVVMSYHEGSSGEEGIKKGIENVLGQEEIRYFWMDTKQNKSGGQAKAAKAFELYNEFMPDAVIAADDNAQSMFVVPYLKDKVRTPVIFCGVNNDAVKYGYPASNVTGVLEKKHYREGISFSQLLSPGIKKIALMYKDNPTNQSNISHIRSEKSTYSAEMTDFSSVSSLIDIYKDIDSFEPEVDALLLLNMSSVLDQAGRPIEGKYAVSAIAQTFNKPTIASDVWEVKAGALCGVVKVDEEQGSLAAKMVLDIFDGEKIQDIPITQNRNGRRIINMTTANRLGIKIPSEAIIGTEIVISEPEKKVLVVMSYHEKDFWTQEVREGIESKIENVKLKFFYMDTKNNKAGGKARAEEAYALYEEFKPDAVIAADDNAQSLFVVPYLKDKVKTPVIFCGVNYDALKYGYPASNVTGVIERIHYGESLHFAQIIDPGIQQVAVIYRDTESSRKNLAQLEKEKHSYTVDIIQKIKINSITDLLEALEYSQSQVDAFLLFNPTGITDEKGNTMEGFQAIEAITQRSKKPIISNSKWAITSGLLCGVVRTGHEQGVLAAGMVKDILNGKPVKDILIDQNKNGQRIINVTTAKRLGIIIPSEALRGTILVR